jgi:hypothetical protein
MRIRYVGAEVSTDTFGKTFYQSRWVNIADMEPAVQATLSSNPQFEVEAVIGGQAGEGAPQSLEPAEGEAV